MGRLTDAEHYGYWAHAWWSDDDADAVASAMSTAPVPPTPFPVGFVIRTVLRETEKTKPSGGKENVRRFGGRVAARGGADFDLTPPVSNGARWSVPSASVARVGRGRPRVRDGGSARTSRAPSAECGNAKRNARSRVRRRTRGWFWRRDAESGFRGIPRARSNGGKRLRARRPRAASRRRGPVRFSSRAVTDALAEHAAAAGRAVARLRARRTASAWRRSASTRSTASLTRLVQPTRKRTKNVRRGVALFPRRVPASPGTA